MKCENLQFDLPLYAENILPDADGKNVRAHLAQCPVCRAEFAGFQSLRNDLRNLPRPAVPNDLLYSVKNSIAVELKCAKRKHAPIFSVNFRRWIQYRLMPYAVGTVVSPMITFFLLFSLLSTGQATREGAETAQLDSSRAVLLASNNNSTISGVPYGSEYSLENLPISDETPSINPAGALVALTKSILRGKMKDEEVVVVADVFGDGIAKIAEVVEPPQDERAMLSLEKAMNEKQNNAPFVPAEQDNRAQVVRVIFKIQRVDVIEKTSKTKLKYH
ncbi:MAG: anti-sigma factor family protein [Pyrinomonadaceae bacterium]